MKHYYIRYPRNFANEYDLVWVDPANTDSIRRARECGYERITRKDALRKISNEKYARIHDQNFSGYGSIRILPFDIALPNLSDHDEWIEQYFEARDTYCGTLHCGSYCVRHDIKMISGDGIIFEAAI